MKHITINKNINIEKVKMNKTTKNRDTINLTPLVSSIAENRLTELLNLAAGKTRARSYRWHNKTTVYDLNRAVSFIRRCVKNRAYSMNRFTTLSNEIPSFRSILGDTLFQSLKLSAK